MSSTDHHRPLREMPAALMRWPSPEDAATELLEVFGPIWCRLMTEAMDDLRAELRRGS